MHQKGVSLCALPGNRRDKRREQRCRKFAKVSRDWISFDVGVLPCSRETRGSLGNTKYSGVSVSKKRGVIISFKTFDEKEGIVGDSGDKAAGTVRCDSERK